jgi:sister-chromatid-cohesion protein PDS5
MQFISQKLWAVCDLAMGLILSKTTNYEMKEFPAETRVPTMYFRRHEDSLWVNAKSYLPPEMQVRLFIDVFILIGYLNSRSMECSSLK